MRERLYKAKRIDNDKWVVGYYIGICAEETHGKHVIVSINNGIHYKVDIETICEYIGYSEFTMVNGYGNKLFENDIVETWAERQVYGRRQSKQDGYYKVRGVIKFKHGAYYIDYNNDYNNSLINAKGDEQYDRHLGYYILNFSDVTPYNSEQLKWQQEHNPHWVYHDIIKLGNIFDNSELLNQRRELNEN